MDNQQSQSASQSKDSTTETTNDSTKPETIHYTEIVPTVQSYLKAHAEVDPASLCPDCLERHRSSHETGLDVFLDSLKEISIKGNNIEEVYAMQVQLQMAWTGMVVDLEMAQMDDDERAEYSRELDDDAKSEEENVNKAMSTLELVSETVEEGMILISKAIDEEVD